MTSLFPSPSISATRLVSLQTIAYIHALGIHSHTYMMPSKPLAAKASVFNGNFVDDVASTVATDPDFTEDGLYNDFLKMLGFFYGDIVGLEGASGLHSDQPSGCRRRVSKGDEFNKAAPARQAPAAPAPAAGENGARPTDEPPTPPSGESAEDGAGDPAPGKGAVRGTANSKPDRRRCEKESFHELIQITVLAIWAFKNQE